MTRYLKMEILADSDEDLKTIIDALRTTIVDREPIIDENGDSYIEVTDTELMRESFCLGACFIEIEKEHGIECPFLVEVVELDEAPVGI